MTDTHYFVATYSGGKPRRTAVYEQRHDTLAVAQAAIEAAWEAENKPFGPAEWKAYDFGEADNSSVAHLNLVGVLASKGHRVQLGTVCEYDLSRCLAIIDTMQHGMMIEFRACQICSQERAALVADTADGEYGYMSVCLECLEAAIAQWKELHRE